MRLQIESNYTIPKGLIFSVFLFEKFISVDCYKFYDILLHKIRKKYKITDKTQKGLNYDIYL